MGYGSNSVVLSYELDKARIQVSGGGRPRPADERELIPTDDAGAHPYRIMWELVPTESGSSFLPHHAGSSSRPNHLKQYVFSIPL
jgi:hypothetical protein